MSQEQDHLRKIIEEPDDDLPRLVFADWLDEHDNPDRAEFIRVQCALEQMAGDDPRHADFRRREEELLGQHGCLWAANLGYDVEEWYYRRGFIERVTMCLETSRANILEVLEKAPIRHLRDMSQFCDFEEFVGTLPDLGRLTGLEFWWLYAFDDNLLARILSSPFLANLKTLILHHDRNGNLAEENVLIEAMQSPHRANIEELAVNVDGSWKGPSCRILQALAASPHLRKLRKLDLTNAGDQGHHPEMDVDTIRALGQSPNLAGLRSLDLGNASFPIEAWDEVLRWPCLPKLEWLRLHYARHVNPPSFLTVAEIADLPDYRQAFEQRVANLDWHTESASPWRGNTSWTGLSWAGFRQQHLFSMWPYVQRREYAKLESLFRIDCVTFAGEEAAAAIDALPFHRYQTELAAGLKQAVAAFGQQADATSIYLRVRPDIRWRGNYHLSSERVPERFEPREEYSYSGPLAEFDGASFPEAAAVRTSLPESRPLDPESALHYLLARTVAAFGRCVAENNVPAPIFFSCMHAVFRI